jgi:hypothetical protein
MRQAVGMKNLEVFVLLPGIRINTSATDFCPDHRARREANAAGRGSKGWLHEAEAFLAGSSAVTAQH